MLHASKGLASYNSSVMNRAAAIPPATPMTSPMAATVATSATITPITRSGRAPSARRMPISRVRWTTL